MSMSQLDQAQVIKTVFNAANGSLNVTVVGGGIITVTYDYIALSYTGANLTLVQYYSGGSGGTLVATLTLAYSGSNLISVTKS